MSNRQGDIRRIVASTTPNSGDSLYPSVAQADTVEATFTWVHDVPGDAPPSDVYVLQSGYAKLQILGVPPAGAMNQSYGSAQNAVFSSESKSRLYLAQTQTGWGTADDGLGHNPVVTTTGLWTNQYLAGLQARFVSFQWRHFYYTRCDLERQRADESNLHRFMVLQRPNFESANYAQWSGCHQSQKSRTAGDGG